MNTTRRAVAFAAALGCTFACIVGALAQDYPSHPITMVVPFPAGGPTDTLGRILSERMRVTLGQPIVIENVTGAGSTIGVAHAAQAAPDGYTLSLGNWTSFVGSGALSDVLRLVEGFRTGLAAHLCTDVDRRKKRIAGERRQGAHRLAQSKPRQSIGSDRRRRQRRARLRALFPGPDQTRFQFVPYRGGAPAMQDLVGGQIDLMCAEASQTLTYVRSGR